MARDANITNSLNVDHDLNQSIHVSTKIAVHFLMRSVTVDDIFHILTSNENATAKCTSISQGYIECTFTEDFWWFY